MLALFGCMLAVICGLASASGAAEPPTFLHKWGSFGSGDGQFNAPTSIAVDWVGLVYVADSGNNRIQVFDGETGAFLDKWGTYGVGDGQFDQPLAVGCGWCSQVYVADTGNDRVQRFMSDGSYLSQWGSPGNGPGEFDGPRGITCGWDGNVYVADSGNHRIQKFSAGGEFLLEWSSQGAGPGLLNSPTGLAFLNSYLGNNQAIAVADKMNDRIQVFQLDGALIDVIDRAGLSRPKGVCAVDEPGGCIIWTSFCIADTGHDRVKPQSDPSWGTYGVGDGQFNSPGDVASCLTSLGRLVWVADTGNHRIQLFDFPCVIALSSWCDIKVRYR
jgi:hypothetical protein